MAAAMRASQVIFRDDRIAADEDGLIFATSSAPITCRRDSITWRLRWVSMSEELRPEAAHVRMSDAERQAIVERLLRAVGEGRLTLDEFDERSAGVFAALTFEEVEPFLTDLPGGTGFSPALERAELRTTGGPLKREGRWVVSRRLQVRNKAGSVKLDFTEAVMAHQVIEIELEGSGGITTLVLPPRATVDIELTAGNARVLGVPTSPIAGQRQHFVVRGTHKAGALVIRYQREFWGWRW